MSVALAFPDIYDVGMSHLGLRILYDIINAVPYASAERVFHPWLDMAEYMRENRVEIASLESGKPLRGFDVVGFSLQYELSYTSVLNMLDLGNIPLKSAERGLNDPLVIAGGPCTVNPLPMAPFIDAFLIGDGEEAVKEIVQAVYLWKSEGDGKRESLLKALSSIEGLFVPLIHGTGKPITRRYISSLDDAPYPCSPIVPFTQIVHDRINIEVSRGCTMGCRFCQAGMIYRPLRQRSPERVLEIAEESLKRTGYEEVAFTSLSAGDYPALLPLIKEFNRRFRMVSVSLPSLRVKAVNRDILGEIKSVRKTGFTIAPEAATERLRCVINKDFSMEDYERALEALFSEGWHNLKLYFMVGLPTETDEDVQAIPAMAMKALKTARKYTSRFVNITVSVSPFVPKAHTPFQWCGQADIEEIKRKKDFLRGALRKVNIKGHDENMSRLEAVFARGDARLSELIEAAYREGAVLDAWTESFDMGRWMRAMDKTGVDAAGYAARKFGPEDLLPWDFIDTGIKGDFLRKEFEKAVSAELTEDCRARCGNCGLKCADEGGVIDASITQKIIPEDRLPRKPIRVRARFSKTGLMRHLSHRELITHITRALKRAGVMLEYSKGFHPAPRISFGPPLGVGISGLNEYFDMEIIPGTPLDALTDDVNARLAGGIRIYEIVPLGAGEPSLQDFISKYEYEIICPTADAAVRLPEALRGFMQKDEVVVEREKGSVDIRPFVEEADILQDRVRLRLRDLDEFSARLEEIVLAAFGRSTSELDITRLSMDGTRRKHEGKWPVAY